MAQEGLRERRLLVILLQLLLPAPPGRRPGPGVVNIRERGLLVVMGPRISVSGLFVVCRRCERGQWGGAPKE